MCRWYPGRRTVFRPGGGPDGCHGNTKGEKFPERGEFSHLFRGWRRGRSFLYPDKGIWKKKVEPFGKEKSLTWPRRGRGGLR